MRCESQPVAAAVCTALSAPELNYSSSAFTSVDVHGRAWQTVVVRAAYRMNIAAQRAELTRIANSLRPKVKPSDCVPFKRRCDVLINASAHSPDSRPRSQFQVAVTVSRGQRPLASVVTRPAEAEVSAGHGNQGWGRYWPSELRSRWAMRRERTPASAEARQVLLQKSLLISGARWFARGSYSRLGMPWTMTAPEAFTTLPIRDDYALGGECTYLGRNVALAANPTGLGFVEPWYIYEQRPDLLPAPRIEYVNAPMDAEQWWEAVTHAGFDHLPIARLGPVPASAHPSTSLSASLSARSPNHLKRQQRTTADINDPLGSSRNIQAPFVANNCAPEDQQLAEFPRPDIQPHWVKLTNLLPSAQAFEGAVPADEHSLEMQLPSERFCVKCAGSTSKYLPMWLDTIEIDCEAQQLELVWRLTVPAGAAINQGHVGMLSVHETVAMPSHVGDAVQWTPIPQFCPPTETDHPAFDPVAVLEISRHVERSEWVAAQAMVLKPLIEPGE